MTSAGTSGVRSGLLTAGLLVLAASSAFAQEGAAPHVAAGRLPDGIVVDGRLDEAAWAASEAIDTFTQTDPNEGDASSERTTMRVLASSKALVIGITCDDSQPDAIVSYSVRRDASLNAEDHIRLVLGPFLDGRSGYVFAVNPGGAQYDALIEPGGDSENADWDGIWDAKTTRTSTGWSAEIWIPVQTLSFKPGLREWHFNAQRRIQRRLETDRWAFPARQYKITQTSRAGVLTGLPEFSLGLGLSVRPAVTTGGGIPSPTASVEGEFRPSLDITQRLGSNLLASATVNTDFAETEVDTRRTNLTRFPLFFPEKRTFFLEGSDIFSFGSGLGQDVIPFFSRSIGLASGKSVPVLAGGKVNGRVRSTNLGGLIVGTGEKAGLVDTSELLASWRVKQNVLKESWIGAIASVGDPRGRSGSWMAGADFTYATSRFRGNSNLLLGAWALSTGRADLGGDSSSYGITASYPNDRWNIGFNGKRIGKDFDPSLGFVPRRAVFLYDGTAENRTVLRHGPIQQLEHEFRPTLATDSSGRWESYRVFMAPINWRFRTGDRVEFNVNPTGERLVAPFEVADGVVIGQGSYQWRRYRLEAGTAQKRHVYTQLTYWFGGFYGGDLHQFIWSATWNPLALLTVELSGERDNGHLPVGDFTQTLVGNRLRVNVSPDLSVSSYIQYDTATHSVGVNTRLRWAFLPVGDLFVVYNHNIRSLEDRWQLDSNQLLVKLQYAWRL